MRSKKSYRKIDLDHGVLPFHMSTATKIPSCIHVHVQVWKNEVKWQNAAASMTEIYSSQTGSARSATRIRKACRAQAIYLTNK
jgi:hypothetical protein